MRLPAQRAAVAGGDAAVATRSSSSSAEGGRSGSSTPRRPARRSHCLVVLLLLASGLGSSGVLYWLVHAPDAAGQQAGLLDLDLSYLVSDGGGGPQRRPARSANDSGSARSVLAWRPLPHLRPHRRNLVDAVLRSLPLPVAYLVSAFVDLRPVMSGQAPQVVVIVAANVRTAPPVLTCRIAVAPVVAGGAVPRPATRVLNVRVRFSYVNQFLGRVGPWTYTYGWVPGALCAADAQAEGGGNGPRRRKPGGVGRCAGGLLLKHAGPYAAGG